MHRSARTAIAVAVCLLTGAEGAAWATAVLFAIFCVAQGLVLLQGRAGAPCACFGSARREPVSGVELVRNAMLMALAIVATGAASPGWPGVPALVVVTVTAAMGRVLLGVLDLRRRTGSVWPGVPS